MQMNKLPIFLLALIFTLAFSGCEKKGPAEQAGERIDNAMESMGDAVEEIENEVE